MINRAGNKEKAKRVLNENGNLSGMVGMEILYRVIAAITSVLLGAMIAGGIGVVSAVVSAPFKLFGLAGIIIAYVRLLRLQRSSVLSPVEQLPGRLKWHDTGTIFLCGRMESDQKSPASLMHLISLCNLPLLQECGC